MKAMVNMKHFLFVLIIVLLISVTFVSHSKQSNVPCSVNLHTIDNVLSADVCNYLINIGETRFNSSTVYNNNTNEIDIKSRTSQNGFFERGENEIIRIIEGTIANLCDVNVKQLEPIQLGKYTKGQEYKWHYDYFEKSSSEKNNQRIKTVLIYLNSLNVTDGGETQFYYLDKSFTPQQGKCIMWNNMNNGMLLEKTLHCSKPIKTDVVKYIMTIWIREHPL
jgi:prolyl 4-hydroxylase